jgi:hypothetical protein
MFMDNPDDQSGQALTLDVLDELYWRDEILQVMYWYKGEGFGEVIAARDLTPFLPADEAFLNSQLEHLVVEGYLERKEETPTPRYAFTAYGVKEGARRFADEFAGLTGQAHGECGPNCPHCKDIPRDSCVHCSSS